MEFLDVAVNAIVLQLPQFPQRFVQLVRRDPLSAQDAAKPLRFLRPPARFAAELPHFIVRQPAGTAIAPPAAAAPVAGRVADAAAAVVRPLLPTLLPLALLAAALSSALLSLLPLLAFLPLLPLLAGLSVLTLLSLWSLLALLPALPLLPLLAGPLTGLIAWLLPVASRLTALTLLCAA